MSFALDPGQLSAGLSRAFDAFDPKPWQPLPHQIPPPGDWLGWLLLAGRGAGKTDACAAFMVEHVNGPRCLPGAAPHWMGIVAPTLGDAATSGWYGPSGIAAHDPSAQLFASSPGGAVIRWPNGSECKLFGTDTQNDVKRLRAGGNRCLQWLEELAQWRWLQDGFDQMTFGLRAGPHPRWIGSTTPRPRPLIKDLAGGQQGDVVVTTGVSTEDNPHLPAHIRAKLVDRYGGTSLGAQELHGRIVEQDENALWLRAQIEQYRIAAELAPRERMRQVIVGVDPSGGSGEQGIVVVGKSREIVAAENGDPPVDRGYVLADYTCHLSPDGWGRRAVAAAVDWQAGEIAVEINYGGDMAVATIASAAQAMGVPIPIRKVRASVGKRVRAEPVSAIAARGRLPHAGVFEQLEDQQCTWVPGESDYSPDRLDALVWAVTKLGLVPMVASSQATMPGQVLASRSLTQRRA